MTQRGADSSSHLWGMLRHEGSKLQCGDVQGPGILCAFWGPVMKTQVHAGAWREEHLGRSHLSVSIGQGFWELGFILAFSHLDGEGV